jgi:hypothetical protein
MQRWEYRVVSLRPGHYTKKLNEYGRDGWELVSVASDVPEVPAPKQGRAIPVPRAFERIEDAAAKLNKLGGANSTEASGGPTSTLLWVFRRPLSED